MISQDTANHLYEAYRRTYINDVKESNGYGKGIESVCNLKELSAIYDSVEDKNEADILERMRERVGQPGLNPNKVKSDYFPRYDELPLIG